MSFILEHYKPIFFNTININWNYNTTSINFF